MYISTHTVAHHLRQAFRKLAIASRVELTRVVIEQAMDGSRLAITNKPGHAYP
jgi:DNA-binding NarL/FixJ family response regulator